MKELKNEISKSSGFYQRFDRRRCGTYDIAEEKKLRGK